jgi:hypothetical protein
VDVREDGMTTDTLSEASFLNAVEALRANNAKNLAPERSYRVMPPGFMGTPCDAVVLVPERTVPAEGVYGRTILLTPAEVRKISRGPQALRDTTARVLRRWRRQRRET